jgi:broad specificity phosphatase PhoE
MARGRASHRASDPMRGGVSRLSCEAMTLLHLIRHGRASAPEADYDQLHAIGEQQARLLGAHLAARRQRYDGVYVGPLKRQRETLRLMREGAGEWSAQWPQAHVLDGLAEGPFEVLMKVYLRPRIKIDPELQALRARMAERDEAAQMDALNGMFNRMIALWRAGEISAPDLETASVFGARVRAAQAEIARREGPERHVAVVTSNGVIGELLHEVARLERPESGRLRFHNTSVSLIELRPEGARLHAQNVTEHLSAPEHLTLL